MREMRKIVPCYLLATLFGASALASESATIVASEDGFVQYSGSLGYSVGTAEDRIQTSRSSANNVRNGVYEFNLASLPAWAVITEAKLLLTTRSLVSNTQPVATVEFYAFLGDGVVTDSDHQNITAGTLIATETFATGLNGPATGTLIEFEFIDLQPLQDAIDLGADFLTIRSQTFDFTTFQVHSLETPSSTATVPTLMVSYVPEPASLSLFALGGLLLARRSPRTPRSTKA